MTTQRILSPAVAAFEPQTTVHVSGGHALGYYDMTTGELATIAWRAAEVEDAAILEQDHSIVVRLTLGASQAHLRFGSTTAASLDDASAQLAAADAAAQVAPGHVP
jgi:hypothetical protein